MPQHDDQSEQSQHNSLLDWRKYSQVWVKQRLQKMKRGNKTSDHHKKSIPLKRDRMKAVEDLRRGLSKSQLNVFNKDLSVMNPDEKSFSGQPLRMFIHGGPGTGKSHLIETIKEFASIHGKSVKCMSISGCAAKLIGGVTCHSAAALKLSMPREGDLNEPKIRRLIQKKMRDKQTSRTCLVVYHR